MSCKNGMSTVYEYGMSSDITMQMVEAILYSHRDAVPNACRAVSNADCALDDGDIRCRVWMSNENTRTQFSL